MSTPASPAEGRTHTAGAYDVRVFIAGLIGFYGIVLVVMGLFADTADDKAKTGDVNANLWSGLVMLAMAVVFAVWARLRPVIVDEKAVEEAHEEEDAPGA